MDKFTKLVNEALTKENTLTCIWECTDHDIEYFDTLKYTKKLECNYGNTLYKKLIKLSTSEAIELLETYQESAEQRYYDHMENMLYIFNGVLFGLESGLITYLKYVNVSKNYEGMLKVANPDEDDKEHTIDLKEQIEELEKDLEQTFLYTLQWKERNNLI